jgi:hypothetical protein
VCSPQPSYDRRKSPLLVVVEAPDRVCDHVSCQSRWSSTSKTWHKQPSIALHDELWLRQRLSVRQNGNQQDQTIWKEWTPPYGFPAEAFCLANQPQLMVAATNLIPPPSLDSSPTPSSVRLDSTSSRSHRLRSHSVVVVTSPRTDQLTLAQSSADFLIMSTQRGLETSHRHPRTKLRTVLPPVLTLGHPMSSRITRQVTTPALVHAGGRSPCRGSGDHFLATTHHAQRRRVSRSRTVPHPGSHLQAIIGRSMAAPPLSFTIR